MKIEKCPRCLKNRRNNGPYSHVWWAVINAGLMCYKCYDRMCPHNIKIGDIFSSVWGYDQTNVEFWECVSVSGALITVREIAQQREYTESMSGNCLPIPGKFIGEDKKCRVQYGTRIKVSECAHASLLDFTEIAGMKIFKSTGFSCYA